MYHYLFTFIFLLQFACFSFCQAEGNTKIVYLISGPRSLSTVFLRMMESRGDFAIYHEPTVPVYDKVHFKDITSDWFRDDANVAFEDVKNQIYNSAKSSNVFIKDMSFSSRDYILSDEEFMSDPSIYFMFLVRNPHHTSISFYLKCNDVFPEMSDLIGLRQLHEEYEAVKKLNPNKVKIVFTEQLYINPRETMKQVCHHLQIPFLESMFVWKKYQSDFQGHSEWNEQKVGNHIHHWHGRAINSEKIETPTTYETDERGEPTFSEINNAEHREKMKQVYRENLIYYNKFIKTKEDHLL